MDLDALVETLPVADKQLIAISRALLDNAKLIIMDEPTTALTKKEVTRLFEIITDLKRMGSQSSLYPISWMKCLRSPTALQSSEMEKMSSVVPQKR